MDIKLHANATTTPKTRAYIQASHATTAALARELNVDANTIRRWRRRKDVADRPHTPHTLATEFSAEEEAIVVELRTRLQLSLDDILEVAQRCLRPTISRSALHRCLQRHAISRRPPEPKPEAQRFDPQPFGYVHIDLKHLTRLDGKPAYVVVAIERTTRFVHVEIVNQRSAAAIAACLERFLAAFGHPVHTILTDNGAEFTDRFGAARWHKRERGTGNHPFDKLCQARGIRHKLTRPYRPQTNGMAERFNRRLGDALDRHPRTAANAGKNRFASQAERNSFIHTFVNDYNRTRLRCLGHKAPAELKANLSGHNTKAGTRNFGSGSSHLSPGRWRAAAHFSPGPMDGAR
ncbi:MAG: DDE-type integrase/transposase/recombinase [Actinobacteria bacterium]|nr:DDE-type integrase/transposase/recombinase [Actinomycetota bacterium]